MAHVPGDCSGRASWISRCLCDHIWTGEEGRPCQQRSIRVNETETTTVENQRRRDRFEVFGRLIPVKCRTKIHLLIRLSAQLTNGGQKGIFRSGYGASAPRRGKMPRLWELLPGPSRVTGVAGVGWDRGAAMRIRGLGYCTIALTGHIGHEPESLSPNSQPGRHGLQAKVSKIHSRSSRSITGGC